MMDEFKKLLAQKKKENGEMSPDQKKAKMKVSEELRSLADKMLGSELPGLKKVTVASNSEEGLKRGLEKAEDLLEQKKEAMGMKKEMLAEEEPKDPLESEDEIETAKEDPMSKVKSLLAGMSEEERKKLLESMMG